MHSFHTKLIKDLKRVKAEPQLIVMISCGTASLFSKLLSKQVKTLEYEKGLIHRTWQSIKKKWH